MLNAWRNHWLEYLMEAAGLGCFMLSACLFGTLLQHPGSPIITALPDGTLRRALMGLAMGLTSVTLVYSPWGRQSGAHLNPVTTLTFLRLGKVQPADAAGYVTGQFLGAVAGVQVAYLLLGSALADPAVRFVVTRPGMAGLLVAFVAEVGISFGMMTLVLHASNSARWSRLTGLFAGCLVALYIVLEAPLSGMSMNPARTLGSAIGAGDGTALWLYFVAPPLGMLSAASVYLRFRGAQRVRCAKLLHDERYRCIFCGHPGTTKVAGVDHGRTQARMSSE